MMAEPTLAEPEAGNFCVAETDCSESQDCCQGECVAQGQCGEGEPEEPSPQEPGVVEPGMAEPGVAQPDVSEPDVMEPDVMEPEMPPPFPTPVQCGFNNPGDPEKERLVLFGHTFTETPGVNGTEISSHILSSTGELISTGRRFDVGIRPDRILFVPSGELALVLSENGMLSSVWVETPERLWVIDTVQLPSAIYHSMYLRQESSSITIVGSNSTLDSGVSEVILGCEGENYGRLTVVPSAFFPLRLSSSLGFLPGKQNALLVGGEAIFEPVDTMDVRLIAFQEGRWVETGAFDIFGSTPTSEQLGMSPEGDLAILTNSSAFSDDANQVSIVSIGNGTVTETVRLTGLGDSREAHFSSDGSFALLTLGLANRVRILTRNNDIMEIHPTEILAGLAGQLAWLRRGSLNNTVLIPYLDPNTGTALLTLRITSPDQFEETRLMFPEGNEHIIESIAITP